MNDRREILIEKYIEPSEITKFLLNVFDYKMEDEKWRNEDGELDSVLGHPSIVRYNLFGEVTEKVWHKKGKLHRERDKPAIIIYQKKKTMRKHWLKNSRSHRDEDKPAIIDYHENGKVKLEAWCKNGHEHRYNDEPAVIAYDENGKISKKEWFNNGLIMKCKIY
jgi:antitoxin component YwqK of YwqJK toxin-antitoxin module